MAGDYAIELRAALLKAMKASATITALIPKASIYPSTVPAGAAWPLSRIGSVIVSPLVADGLNSTSMRVLVQGMAKDVSDGGAIQVPAEDSVYRIGSAFKAALDGAVLPLASGGNAKFEWERGIPLQDRDDTAIWYVTATFEVEITPP